MQVGQTHSMNAERVRFDGSFWRAKILSAASTWRAGNRENRPAKSYRSRPDGCCSLRSPKCRTILQCHFNMTPLLGAESRELKSVVGYERSNDFRGNNLPVDVG